MATPRFRNAVLTDLARFVAGGHPGSSIHMRPNYGELPYMAFDYFDEMDVPIGTVAVVHGGNDCPRDPVSHRRKRVAFTMCEARLIDPSGTPVVLTFASKDDTEQVAAEMAMVLRHYAKQPEP